jgi:hypothetical protein
MSNDHLKLRSKHNFIGLRRWTEHPSDRLSLSLQNKESNAENAVSQVDEKTSSVVSSSNSIRKTYGQLSNSPSSAVDGNRQDPLPETATPAQDDLGNMSRQTFVKKLAAAAFCAAILDFAFRANWNVDKRPAHVIHAQYAKKESPKQVATESTRASAPDVLPVIAAVAQASGGAALMLGGALLSLLKVSIPFVVTNIAAPAAAKLAHLSADVLPSAEQLAASASAIFLPSVEPEAAASLPSPADLPDGVRTALSQALIPVSEQTAAASAAADAVLRAAKEALAGPAAQVPPSPPFPKRVHHHRPSPAFIIQ